VAVLASKPGLASPNVIVPKDWSQKWFADFVSNLLQGADVRNAVGSNGIVVSGTIASPYASIALGGTSPIVLPNNITLSPTSGVALTINQAGGTDGIEVFATAGNAATIVAAGNGVTAANGAQLQYSATGNLNLNLGGQIRWRLAAGGASIFGWGPTAGALVDMTPDIGSYTGTLTGVTASTTATIVWQRNGNQMTIFVPAFSALNTSSTSMSITGGPAILQATRSQVMAIPVGGLVMSAAATSLGSVSMGVGSSTITFLISNSSTGFTNDTLTKGINRGFTFTYLLN
jgi:hypothetical protein